MSPTQKKELISAMNHQAEMKALWPTLPTITEALLIAALRHLHAIIEADRRATDKAKAFYWELEREM